MPIKHKKIDLLFITREYPLFFAKNEISIIFISILKENMKMDKNQ